MPDDVSLSVQDKPHSMSSPGTHSENTPINNDDSLSEDDVEEHHDWLQGNTAVKFLLAGGIAGAGKCGLIHTKFPTSIVSFQSLAHVQHPLTVSKSS